jgi:putative copper export protein
MLAVLATFQQWVLYSGFVLITGCVAWRVAVAPGAARLLPTDRSPAFAALERRVAAAGAVTGMVLIGAWLLRMVAQVMGFRDPFVPLQEDVSFLLFETFWGTVWMVQGPIVVLLTLVLWRASTPAPAAGPGSVASGSSSIRWEWLVATLLAVALAATLALSSHAMGVEAWRSLIVTLDGIHALTAGSWIGGLGVILFLGRAPRGAPAVIDLFAAQIRSFSRLAMLSVALLVSTGVVLAWAHLTALADLWTTTYGWVLSAKVGFAAAVLAIGFVNWRQGVPIVDSEVGSRETWRRAAWEVGIAAGVLLLTAVLVHSPKP